MGKLIHLLALMSTLVSTNCLERDIDEPLFLSEFILAGDYSAARNLSVVRHKEMDWLTSHAGYITVNKQLSSNMFFWYFPAKYGASTAPLVLWLQGGPGSPSMHGIFKANGPFAIGSDRTLKSRKHSWHFRHNLLYIDNPVGELGSALLHTMLAIRRTRTISAQICTISYAGKYALALGHTILKNAPSSVDKTKINLQGLAIESGFIDPVNMLNYGDILYHNGMIDSKNTVFTNLTGSSNYYNTLLEDNYDFSVVDEFMNRPDVRQAINVGTVEYQPNEFNNLHLHEEDRKVEFSLKRDIMQSVTPWLSELLKHHKVFLFNGQLDILCGYSLSENSLKKLKFNGAEEYQVAERRIWRVDNEVAGYVKEAGKLTEIVVRNAGHYVSIDQPKWVLDILTKLTSGEGF
ncbi:hypothetical protein HA402_003375 [Bradysia odoriphaga]|nr:hypothetical protein HA402_003375 [Bradysia odoriphaga]